MNRSRRVVVSMVACAMVIAGCAGGDGESADSVAPAESTTTVTAEPTDSVAPSPDSTPATDAPAATCDGERTASMPGVSAEEIRVAATAQDVARLAEIGLGIDLGDIRGTFEAFVDEVNDAGGICGRSLVLDAYAEWSSLTAGSDQEACLEVTKDTEVAAVFATAGWSGDAARCTAAAGERLLIADGEYAAATFDAAAGRLFTLTPPPELTLSAMVDYAAAEGLLDGTVGVLYGTDYAEEGDLVDSVVLPALDELGATVETCRMSMSAGGANGSTEINLCMEQFASAEVSTVLSSTDLFSMLLGKLEAANLGFDATWVGSTYPANTNVNAGPLLFESFGGTEVMDGQLGLTSVATFETVPENVQSCLDTWQAATGEQAANASQIGLISTVCTMVRQFADATERAGVNPTQADLIAALEATGSFMLPSGIEGAWRADQHAAAEQLRVVRFVAADQAYEEVRGFEPLAR